MSRPHPPLSATPSRLLLTLAALAVAVALLLAFLSASPAAAQSARIQITTDAEYIPADGGSAQLVVSVSGPAVRSGEVAPGDRIALSAELGVFGGETGPSRAELALARAAGSLLEARVAIYGDGRAGPAKIFAAGAGATGTLRIAFTGPVAAIAPPDSAEGLLARDRHDFAFQVLDRLGSPLPGQPIEFAISGGEARIIRADRRAGPDGSAIVRITGAAGSASVRASAGAASAEFRFALQPEPVALLFVALDPGPIQRGSAGEPGSVWLLLTDADGRGVPGQEIGLALGDSGLAIISERADGRLLTDAQGSLFARFDAASAAPGSHVIAASWRGELEDRIAVQVAGRPAALYLAAERLAAPASGAPDAYRITASLVDAASRPVADGRSIRWTLDGAPDGAALDSPLTPVSAGASTVVLSLPAAPTGAKADAMIKATVADLPRVGQSAMLSSLLGAGTALRRGINRVTWVGAEAPVHEAMAPIARLAGEVWRWDGNGGDGDGSDGSDSDGGERDGSGGGWQRYRLGAGDEGSFALRPGDELYIRVDTAVVLPLVAR